ncbi:MAG TPA: NADH-quinone oxidoreductase subunit K [Acidimicrobiales bacterium]
MSILLAFVAAMLFGIGTYLVMQRKLSRIIIGLALITHGANVLLLLSGRRGSSPIIGTGDEPGFADPLPQALALTAIVISFATTALLLALAYRSWLLTEDDEVQDDVADRLIATGGARDKEIADEEAMRVLDDDVEEAVEADEPSGAQR